MKILAALLLIAPIPVQAADLTIRTGETWVFGIKGGQPVGARKVDSQAKPAKGQIKVSVKAMLGTAMFVTNNSPVAYAVRAELLDKGRATAARTCVIPANGRPVFEQWQQKAEAVRLGTFTVTPDGGKC